MIENVGHSYKYEILDDSYGKLNLTK
jgi:hypothetical protein